MWNCLKTTLNVILLCLILVVVQNKILQLRIGDANSDTTMSTSEIVYSLSHSAESIDPENIDTSVTEQKLSSIHRIAHYVSATHNTSRKSSIPHPSVDAVDCQRLFDRDEELIKFTTFIQENHPHTPNSADSYVFPPERCKEFVDIRRYITSSMDEEEAEFPIAYSILMYKDVEQTERLLRMVYRPQNLYCIHVDIKSSGVIYDAMRSIAACFPNVILASRRSDVYWGQFSVLEPELTCMRDLLKWKWRYFINLTGQEVPLRTNYQLVKILSVYNGANDVGSIKRSRNLERITYVHKRGWQTRQVKTRPPHNITIYKGGVHAALSRGFCRFLLGNEKASDFVEWLKDTGVPDETLFGTLNRHPQFGIPGAYLGNDDTNQETNPSMVRFKNWGKYPCAGITPHAICVFSVGDLWQLANRKELFANKFHSDFHPLAYDCMEERYFKMVNREMRGDTYFNTTYYENLKFVLNHQ